MQHCTDIKHAIKVLAAQEGITQSELASRMDSTQSIISRTLGKPDHRITSDLLPIASALGCTLELRFVRSDGSVAASVAYIAEGEQAQEG